MPVEWIIIGVLGAIILYLLFRKQSGGAGDVKEALVRMEGRLQQVADDGRKSQSELTKAVEDRLDKVGERMGKSLSDTAEKTAKSMGEVHTRLKVIDEAQKNITALSGDIMGLQSILENKQARGAFGEVQLENIVSNILSPDAYSFQTTLTNGKRVDCLLNLPNPPGPICVDSKFPLDSYQALMDASDDAQKLAARRQLKTDMKTHIKAISERYIVPGETAESALMFLPSEAVYAELHANFRDVVEESYKARVWIVSPTTMMATLNTIRALFRDVKMREQASLIQQEVEKLLVDAGRLDERVDKLTKHFSLAEKDIQDIKTSTTKITKRSDKIRDVQLEEGDGEEVIGAAEGPRLVVDGD